MSDATTPSSHNVARWLLVPLMLLVLLVPSQAMGQCYAVTSGNWTDQIWNDNSGASTGEAAGDLNCASNGAQYPNAGDNAVITSGVSVDVTTDLSATDGTSTAGPGDVTINDLATGLFLNGGDLTAQGLVSVGTSGSATSALTTFADNDETDLSGDASGKLTADALTVNGTVKVFREGGSDGTTPDNGELVVTDANGGSGDLTINSSGTFIGGPLAPANQVGAGTFTDNGGTYTSQRCYALSGGSWGTTGNWAPIGGTDASLQCDGGGNGDGIPNSSNESVVITSSASSAPAQNGSNRTIHSAEIDDGAFGIALTGGALTVENNLTVGRSTSPSGAKLITFLSSFNTIDADGLLDVNGSATVFGTLGVDRDDSGSNDTGELDLEGNVIIKSSGILDVNQNNSSSPAPISIGGDLTNNGDINHDGAGSAVDFTVKGSVDNNAPFTVANTGTVTIQNTSDGDSENFTNDGDFDAAGNVTVAGNVVNNGNLSLNGNNLSATNTLGSSETSGTLKTGGGTLDLSGDAHSFDIKAGGELDIGAGRLELTGNLTQNETLTQNAGATILFDGDAGQQVQDLSGNGSSSAPAYSGSNGLQNVTVAEGATVDPATFTGTDAIDINETLTLEDTGGESDGSGQWGSGSSEDAEVTYRGFSFDIQNDGVGNPGEFFSARVDFNNTGSDSSSPIEASGTVFSVFSVVDGFVKVVDDLVVNDKFRIGTGTVKLGTGNLTVNDDFENNDTFKPNTKKVTFSGGGATTADGNSTQNITSSGTVTFDALSIDGQDTKVKLGDDADVNGDLIIDSGASDSNVQLILGSSLLNLEGNLTNNGTLKTGTGKVTLDGSSSQSISSVTSSVEFDSLETQNSSGVTLDGITLTVTDSLIVSDSPSPGNGGGLVVDSGDILKILGDARLASGDESGSPTTSIENAGGEVVLVSGSNASGQIIYVDQDGGSSNGVLDGVIKGTVTKQRRLNGATNRWYSMAAPAAKSGADTFEEYFESTDTAKVSTPNGYNDLWTQGFTGADASPGDPSRANLVKYDETVSGAVENGWKAVQSASTTMEKGRGYLIRVFGDDDLNDNANEGLPKLLDNRIVHTRSTTFDWTSNPGLTNQGTSDDDGWNLVGNPYLAPIDWDKLNRSSNIDATVYVREPSAESFIQYNTMGGGNLTKGHIAPQQAFFIHIDGTSTPTFDMNIVDDQVNPSDDRFVGKASESTPPNLEFEMDLGSKSESAFVMFSKKGKRGKDRYDGYQIATSTARSTKRLHLYSVVNDGNTSFNINVLPREVSDERTIPLAAKAGGCESGSAWSGTAR